MKNLFRGKRLILLLLIVFALGAATFQLFKSNIDNGQEGDPRTLKEKENQEYVSDFSTDNNHYHTLNDFIISASGGEYIIKMTITLNFDSERSYLRFKGIPEDEDNLKNNILEDGELSIMEIAINDEIGSLMFNIDTETLFNKDELKQYLIDGLNKSFKVNGDKLIQELYIENLIVQ